MKKIRTIILAAGLMGAMIFCMTGCGEDALKPSGNNSIYQQSIPKSTVSNPFNEISRVSDPYANVSDPYANVSDPYANVSDPYYDYIYSDRNSRYNSRYSYDYDYSYGYDHDDYGYGYNSYGYNHDDYGYGYNSYGYDYDDYGYDTYGRSNFDLNNYGW